MFSLGSLLYSLLTLKNLFPNPNAGNDDHKTILKLNRKCELPDLNKNLA